MSFLLFAAALALYALAAAAYAVIFFSGRAELRKTARPLLLAGFALHGLCVLVRWAEIGRAPLATPHETVSFFAWGLVCGYLTLRLRAGGSGVKNLGLFVSLMTLILMIVAACLPRTPIADPAALPPTSHSLWLPVHASLSLLAYGFFALAGVGGLMYLLQERNMKRKRFGLLYNRLPSLETLDRLGGHCLSVGFPLLTLGMITGSLWAYQAHGSYWRWNPTEVWTLLTWLMYAALFHQRLTVGWRGRRAAWLGLAALAFALFTFWGVTTFFSGYHGNFN